MPSPTDGPTPARGPLHLTFDDGPGPEGTREVLRALRIAEARATFFVLGERVREHPGLVAEIRSAGHRVELHGDAHLDHRGLDEATLSADTAAAITALRASGVETMWWRLPWGRPGPATTVVARRHGLRIVGWDVDTHDWRGDGPEAQPPAFTAGAQQGGVVLGHDGFGPGATRGSIGNTVALTEAITATAAAAGTPATPLPDPADPAAASLPVDGAEHEAVAA